MALRSEQRVTGQDGLDLLAEIDGRRLDDERTGVRPRTYLQIFNDV